MPLWGIMLTIKINLIMNNIYEHSKFLIGRFDHYYESVNSKGSFMIGLNTFVLGGIIAGYAAYSNHITMNSYSWFLLCSLFAFCISSTILTINALHPFTRDNFSNKKNNSLIFFGGIAKHNADDFTKKFKSQKKDKIEDDIIKQVHALAVGLNKKYKKLKIGSYCLVAQFLVLLLLSLYFIKNFHA